MEPATIATRGKPLRVNAADTAIAIEPRELTIDPRTYATPLDAALAAVHEANDAWKKSRSGTTIIDDDDDDNLRVRVDVLTSKTDSGTVDDVVGLLESTGLFWKDAVGDIVPQVETQIANADMLTVTPDKRLERLKGATPGIGRQGQFIDRIGEQP